MQFNQKKKQKQDTHVGRPKGICRTSERIKSIKKEALSDAREEASDVRKDRTLAIGRSSTASDVRKIPS